jgi:choline dehydrogenase-like flavoprotein
MLSGAGNAEELRRHGITTVSNLPGVGENLQDHPFITAFVAETKAPMAAASRAESQLFFRSTKAASTPDIHATRSLRRSKLAWTNAAEPDTKP